MVSLIVAGKEFFDDKTGTFITINDQSISLEHSLIAIRRWESKWLKPYFSKKPKNKMETFDYIRCMSINKEISLETVMSLTNAQFDEINQYIMSPMTATTFSKDNTPPDRRILTAEVILSQMIDAQIPFECQKWHINQLFTLLKVCGLKNQKSKKMSKNELANRNREENQRRRALMNSKG